MRINLVGTIKKIMVLQIILNHVDFESDKELLQILLEGLQTTSNLKYLEAKKCKNQPKFTEEKNENKESKQFNSLEWIIIEECLIEEMPINLLKRAPVLKGLSLSGNKIHAINVQDLTASKMSVSKILKNKLEAKQV